MFFEYIKPKIKLNKIKMKNWKMKIEKYKKKDLTNEVLN